MTDRPPLENQQRIQDRPKYSPGIMASLPRREFIQTDSPETTPAMMHTAEIPVGRLLVFSRLWVWIFAGTSFLLGSFWNWLRRRDSEMRRAVRFRKIFERRGGTFRKIGRLLAMRVDLLPWEYCVELSKVVDQMEPFPVEEAIAKIESATGKALKETFEQFDPDPIVSSTLACVYQAILLDGEKVAVKVRRPGIGKLFMADVKALEWLLKSLESLSILRPDYTLNLRRELRISIQDELNFLLEARYQALFRREAKKTGRKFFNSPRVYFELCSTDVTVQVFTAGMWLWELLAAVEQNDQEALERAAQLNIDPKKVAKRLLWVNSWGLDEHLLFRADLHPDNVIIRKNSKLTFIDFSSVGALSQEKKTALQHTMRSAWKRDPLEMAHESMVLLEPLPPIDTIKFTRDLEAVYWPFIYALESKHREWWECTTARLWLGFVRVAKEHNIALNLPILRLIRTNLLHDTIAARLCPEIDHVDEYRKFHRYRAEYARRRVEERIYDQFTNGSSGRIYLQVEDFLNTSQRLYRQLQRQLSIPVMKINAVLGKSFYSLAIGFRLLGHAAIATGIALAIYYGYTWLVGADRLQVVEAAGLIFSKRPYQLVILLLVFVNFRTMLYRMSDKEV